MTHDCNRAHGFGLLSGLQVEPCREGWTVPPAHVRDMAEAAVRKLERGEADAEHVRLWTLVLPQSTRILPAPDRAAFLARWEAASAPAS
jgi:hypothetical protein